MSGDIDQLLREIHEELHPQALSAGPTWQQWGLNLGPVQGRLEQGIIGGAIPDQILRHSLEDMLTAVTGQINSIVHAQSHFFVQEPSRDIAALAERVLLLEKTVAAILRVVPVPGATRTDVPEHGQSQSAETGEGISVDPAALSHYEKHRTLVDSLADILRSQASAESIDAEPCITVGLFTDPEDSLPELVVSQHVNMPMDAALAYWDSVGEAIEAWASTLPSLEAERLGEEIAVAIKWQ